jgi:hypothetical protein
VHHGSPVLAEEDDEDGEDGHATGPEDGPGPVATDDDPDE